MKINNLIYIVLLGIIVSLTSCEDDDSLFSGNENYITSFRLVQQGDSYAGIIKGDSLILSIPENLSLEGAIMEILCSENARISPDPGEVEDWGKLQNFTVTAYNNTQRVYKYIVRRTLTGSEGDVRLTSVEDLEAFAAQGINKVNGNLVIGKEEGTVKEDSLTSLAALASLKEVVGTVTINPTYAGTSFAGLENLEQVGGLVMGRVIQNATIGLRWIREIELPNLKKVASELTFRADTVETLSLPALEKVGRNLSIQIKDVKDIDFSALSVIGENLSMKVNGVLNAPEKLSFPKLSLIGNQLALSNVYRVKELAFPELKSATAIKLEQMNAVETLDFTQLEQVADYFELWWTHQVKEMNFPSVKSLGGFKIYYIQNLEKVSLESLTEVGLRGFCIDASDKIQELNLPALTRVKGDFVLTRMAITEVSSLRALKEVDRKFDFSSMSALTVFDGFPNLTTVGGNFTLSGLAVSELKGFDALTSIGGSMSLSNLNEVTSIDAFPVLKSIGSQCSLIGLKKLQDISLLAQFKGMHLNNCILNNLDALTSLDLTGLEVDALQITGKNALTLKGSKTLNTNLTINGIPGISFSGIEEVQNVSVSNMPATITGRVEYNFPGLKKIGTLSVSQAYGASLGVLRFPDLTEISGKLTLSEGFGQKVQPTEFPVLRIVNNMTYTGVCDALRFPALEEVTGELNIKTSYVNGSLVSMLQEIYTPVLKKVGILVLTTYSKNQDSWCNNVLTNLDCFRALENVGVINIEYQLGLVSFKGLEKAIGGLTDDTSWVVGHNAYNPTFEQAKNGELERN